MSNIKILAKKSTVLFWPKIEILTKNPNLDQKSKFWPNIQILAKNPNCQDKNWGFGQK